MINSQGKAPESAVRQEPRGPLGLPFFGDQYPVVCTVDDPKPNDILGRIGNNEWFVRAVRADVHGEKPGMKLADAIEIGAAELETVRKIGIPVVDFEMGWLSADACPEIIDECRRLPSYAPKPIPMPDGLHLAAKVRFVRRSAAAYYPNPDMSVARLQNRDAWIEYYNTPSDTGYKMRDLRRITQYVITDTGSHPSLAWCLVDPEPRLSKEGVKSSE